MRYGKSSFDKVSKQEEYNLKILTLNVCGLKSKLCIPEFITLIKHYDIIGIQETKLDDVDLVQVNGYQIFTNNRKSLGPFREKYVFLRKRALFI